MSVKKKHREIKLPAFPPRKIPHIVKELVKVLNKQRTDVRSFAAAEKISFSKVYNWIAGKAEPKRDSTEAILRYFRRIKYDYTPKPPGKLTEKKMENKLPAASKLRYRRSVPGVMMEIHTALKSQTEQVTVLHAQLQQVSEKMDQVKFLRADFSRHRVSTV